MAAPASSGAPAPAGSGAPATPAPAAPPTPPAPRIGGGPTRSVAAASWTALGALMLRDVVVLRKHFWEFVLRTLIQPFLLCFVFLYVFPKIGQASAAGAAPPPNPPSPRFWSPAWSGSR